MADFKEYGMLRLMSADVVALPILTLTLLHSVAMGVAKAGRGRKGDVLHAAGNISSINMGVTQPTPDPRIQFLSRNLPWAKSDQPTSWYTNLPHDQEMAFRSWIAENKVPFNPDEPMPDYDMRGYYAKTKGKGWAEGSHFPDTWKTPLHQSFSRESQYANEHAPYWKGDTLMLPDGTVVFQEPPKKAPEK